MAPTKMIIYLLVFWAAIFIAFWFAWKSMWKGRRNLQDRRRDIVNRLRRNTPDFDDE